MSRINETLMRLMVRRLFSFKNIWGKNSSWGNFLWNFTEFRISQCVVGTSKTCHHLSFLSSNSILLMMSWFYSIYYYYYFEYSKPFIDILHEWSKTQKIYRISLKNLLYSAHLHFVFSMKGFSLSPNRIRRRICVAWQSHIVQQQQIEAQKNSMRIFHFGWTHKKIISMSETKRHKKSNGCWSSSSKKQTLTHLYFTCIWERYLIYNP